jgi:hypothetical protein
LNEQKCQKKWGFGGGLGYDGEEEKWGNGGDLTASGGWWWCREAGGGVSVVVGRMGGGGFWILGRLGEVRVKGGGVWQWWRYWGKGEE